MFGKERTGLILREAVHRRAAALTVVPVQSWTLFCLNIALVEKCRFRSVKIWLWTDVDIKFVSNRHFWVKAKIVCLLFPKGECFIKTFTFKFWNRKTNKNNLKTTWHFIWLKMIDGRKWRRGIREYFMLENYSPLFAFLFQVWTNQTTFWCFGWLVPLILRAANKSQKGCRTVYCDHIYLPPKLMSQVLGGSHNFLFNRPWCIFLTLICFITLWIQLSLLVYRKQSGQSVTCIQKATWQIHGGKIKAPSLLIPFHAASVDSA